MDSFKSGNGVLTVANAVTLAVATIYFYKQNSELKSELEKLKRQLAEQRLRMDRTDKETKKEFKRLRRDLATALTQGELQVDHCAAGRSEGPVEDVSVGCYPRPATSSRPTRPQHRAPDGFVGQLSQLPALQKIAPAASVTRPLAAGREAAKKKSLPADVDLDALSSDL